jgi:hypothetical protein
MDIFQNLLNKINRNYGQLDKKVFGGLLPGGAATPIGAALQGFVPPKGNKPLPTSTRRVASLLDAATGAIAGAQPFVEKTIKRTPEPIQDIVSSGLNKLPLSANLFARYYTGLGNKNLELPRKTLTQLNEQLKEAQQRLPQSIKEAKAQEEFFSAAKAGNLVPALQGGAAAQAALTAPPAFLNDALAQIRSDLNRFKKGDIAYSGYYSQGNPLTSTATSIGSAWFKPKGTGFESREKYDFAYGSADTKEIGPSLNILSPSQEFAMRAAEGQNKVLGAGAEAHPLTHFGRAIVSKLPDKSFEYLINTR